ncbi:MAG TPA: hypothetical protein VJV97_06950 [Gemmatimonadaceae bacterium]|nr:hypothetical protein [Gemmatimonadaceae bacterium]
MKRIKRLVPTFDGGLPRTAGVRTLISERPASTRGEDLARDRNQDRMGHPGSVVAITDLAF